MRAGQALKSQQMLERLCTGSLVRELELTHDGRLHYELSQGEGPRTGWVSVQFHGKPLLQRCQVYSAPRPSPCEVIVKSTLGGGLQNGSSHLVCSGEEDILAARCEDEIDWAALEAEEEMEAQELRRQAATAQERTSLLGRTSVGVSDHTNHSTAGEHVASLVSAGLGSRGAAQSEEAGFVPSGSTGSFRWPPMPLGDFGGPRSPAPAQAQRQAGMSAHLGFSTFSTNSADAENGRNTPSSRMPILVGTGIAASSRSQPSPALPLTKARATLLAPKAPAILGRPGALPKPSAPKVPAPAIRAHQEQLHAPPQEQRLAAAEGERPKQDTATEAASDLGGKVLPKEAVCIFNGGLYESLGPVVVRAGEALSSERMETLPAQSVVQVLRAGNGRRVRVRDVKSGLEGWVSVCREDGKQIFLPKLVSPEPPLPGGFQRGQTVFWTRFSTRQQYDANYGSDGLCHGAAHDTRLVHQCVHVEFEWGTGDFFVKWLSRERPPALAAPGAPLHALDAYAEAEAQARQKEEALAAALAEEQRELAWAEGRWPKQPPRSAEPEEALLAPAREDDGAPQDGEVQARAAEVASSAVKNVLPKVKQAEKLGVLMLRDCNLAALPSEATAASLARLRMADLSSNALRKLPDAVGRWENLKALNCAQNMLQALPAGFGDLQCLQRLDLSCNRLRSLPASLGGLGSLRDLDLSSNSLGPALSDAFGGGPLAGALEELNLSGNSLEELAPSVFELKKLLRLRMANNSLHELPQGIAGLKSLLSLDAAQNALQGVCDAVLEMPCLSELWLAGNPIDRQSLQEAFEGFLRRREARINNILVSKVGPVTIDLRVCGLEG